MHRPNASWRKSMCAFFDLPKPPSHDKCGEKRSGAPFLGKPKRIDTIQGDGNCLFRAISKEITCSEEHHLALRKSLIAFILSNKKSFSELVGESIEEYIKRERMACDGTWGTDTELLGFATLLQTSVGVYYKAKWHIYPPLKSLNDTAY